MASNKGVIIELKGVGRKCRGLTLRYSPSIFLEGLRKQEKPQSGKPISGPRFEPGTYRIRNRSANHSATTFGDEREITDCINYNFATNMPVITTTRQNNFRTLKYVESWLKSGEKRPFRRPGHK
jgi:hypothetical protein